MSRSWVIGKRASGLAGPLRLATLLNLSVCAAAMGPAVAHDDASAQIELRDGKLTARIAGTPLRAVMEELNRLRAVDVRWTGAEARERAVSVEFIDLPISEALRRILRGRNFLMVYTGANGGEHVHQLWIDGAERGPEQPILTSSLRPPTTSRQVRPEDGEPPSEALMQVATSDGDLLSRLNAIESLERHIGQEAKAREVLADLARHDENPQVRDVAAAVLGGR